RAARALVQGGLRFRRHQELRHVRRVHAVMRGASSPNRSGAPLRRQARSCRRFGFCAVILAALLLGACAMPRSQPAYSPVILISIDGFRHDYLARGLTPHIEALAADGVHAPSMRASFPT